MSPRIVLATLGVRIRSLYRERSAMFFTFAFPIILVLVFGSIFIRPERLNFDLPVQDNSQSEASARLIEALGTDHVFKVISVPLDTDPKVYAHEHRFALLLVIPKNFQGLHNQRAVKRDAQAWAPVTYIYDPSSTSVDNRILLVRAIMAAVNQRYSGTTAFITLVPDSILSGTYRFIEFFVPGIIAMAIMTSALSNALNSNAELRQKGILRKLAATPITRTDWLAASILYQIILAVVSTVSILLVSHLVYNVRLHIDLMLPVIIVVEVMAFVGIGMLLTPLAREAESASAVANAFLFPMMFLSGTFFPVEMMPQFLQVVARFLPLYYVNEALRAAMIFADSGAVLRSGGVVAAFAAVVFVGGAIQTRWGSEEA